MKKNVSAKIKDIWAVQNWISDILVILHFTVLGKDTDAMCKGISADFITSNIWNKSLNDKKVLKL